MTKVKDRTGQQYNSWTFLKYAGLDSRRSALWLVKCSCGFEKVQKADNIINGQSKRCLKCGFAHQSKSIEGVIPTNMWSRIVRRSTRGDRKGDYAIGITREDAYELIKEQDFKCALSGVDIRFAKPSSYGEQTASLDRIDSNLGYIKGNIQWVHKDINLMKNVLTQERFIELCSAVCYTNNQTEEDVETKSSIP